MVARGKIRRPAAGISSCVFLLIACAGCRRERPQPEELFLNAPLHFAVETRGQAALVVEELKKYAKFFGCPLVSREHAKYVLTGKIELGESSGPEFAGPQAGSNEKCFRLHADLKLVDRPSGKLVESWKPDPLYLTKQSGPKAASHAAQSAARMLARVIFYFGQELGQEDVRNLIADLTIQRLEPYVYNEVVSKLERIGLRAVPYLIWALMFDHRRVELPGDLPDLRPEDAARVKVHHVANYALERILNLSAYLDVDSPPEEVESFARAWWRVWRKRCAGYLSETEVLSLLKNPGEICIVRPPASEHKEVESGAGRVGSGEEKERKPEQPK